MSSQIFNDVTKNRCHLRHHIFSRKVKNTFPVEKYANKFLQLRCSKVLLDLKYKFLLCDLNIAFTILAGGKTPSNRPS